MVFDGVQCNTSHVYVFLDVVACYGVKARKNTWFLLDCSVKHRIVVCFGAQNAQNDPLGAHSGALEPLSKNVPKKGAKKISLWPFWGPFLDPILSLFASIFEV